jgi:DNA invertase Pin-like site-specific DNA recombinase
MKAVFYCRASTKEQADEEQPIAVQDVTIEYSFKKPSTVIVTSIGDPGGI